MNFRKTVKPTSFYREYVKVLNGLLDLSPREIEVYSWLIKLDVEWKAIIPSETKNIISGHNRKVIMKHINMNKSNLSRMITKFRENGMILEKEGGEVCIPDYIKPIVENNKLVVSFILDIDE